MKTYRKRRIPRSKGIAETYIHIKDVPSNLSKRKAKNYLEENVKLWAEQRFKKPVVIKIRVEEGSLKVWVLVGGISLFNLVAGYGSFRSGIDHLVKDSKAFSNYVIEQFVQDENVSNTAVLRAEKRLGVPGKIQRFLKELNALNSTNLSHNDRELKIQKLHDEFINIIKLLDNEQDRELFMENVPVLIQQEQNHPLPEPIPGVLSLEVIRNEENENA